MRDLNEQVRVSAASRLGYTGRVDAVAPLVALAADPTPRVRSIIAYALGRLGSHEATPALLRLLHDPDRHVRENAADALGSVGGPAAVDTLLALAADQDLQLRVQAAKALAKAADSDPRVAPQLAMLARDGEAAVRAATLSGLASADGRPSLRRRLLVELVDDPDPLVRQRVAVVARHLAPDAAPDILHRYTRDHDQSLRQLAATELARLTNPHRSLTRQPIERGRHGRPAWRPTSRLECATTGGAGRDAVASASRNERVAASRPKNGFSYCRSSVGAENRSPPKEKRRRKGCLVTLVSVYLG